MGKVEEAKKILDKNLLFHSSRGGKAVFQLAKSPVRIADEICSLFEPKPSIIEGFIDEEHHALVITGTRAETRGCSFCGNTMTLIMENREYRLWACQPLKGREGCGRLLLEDAREHLGATWYYAEQNEPDKRREL